MRGGEQMKKILISGIIALVVGFYASATLVHADTTPTPTPTEAMTVTTTPTPTQAVQGSTTIPSGAPATGFGY